MLDSSILDQLKQIFGSLQEPITLVYTPGIDADSSAQMKEFLDDIASTSPLLTVVESNRAEGDPDAPSFAVARGEVELGINFVGIPNGHEFSSLLLAILNAASQGKNLPDEGIRRRIENIRGPIHLRTYVSLTCTNCPDVVQALNVVALYNGDITNTTIDGAEVQAEVDRLGIKSVPTVVDQDDRVISVGRNNLAGLLGKLEETFGKDNGAEHVVTARNYDVVVVGAGPAGSAAAVYLSRKGMSTAVVAGRIGGQVNDTDKIDNMISVPHTTGPHLAADLRTHLEDYEIDIFDNRSLQSANLQGAVKSLTMDSGEVFNAPQIVIATGASWRHLNVPGETEHIGHGVAFCTHCDAPFYAGKPVAVVGGGNSGLEAAIDLAALCPQVDVFEFMDSMKADDVLIDKVNSLGNVRVHLSSAVQEVVGKGRDVEGLRVQDRTTGKDTIYPVEGVFVQIGLTPNTVQFNEQLEVDRGGQIKVDRSCRTSVPGVYAAGDCTDVPYKQIIIAMGQGATAALSAFEDRMRGITPTM